MCYVDPLGTVISICQSLGCGVRWDPTKPDKICMVLLPISSEVEGVLYGGLREILEHLTEEGMAPLRQLLVQLVKTRPGAANSISAPRGALRKVSIIKLAGLGMAQGLDVPPQDLTKEEIRMLRDVVFGIYKTAGEKEWLIKAWCVEVGDCKEGGQDSGVPVPRDAEDREGNKIGDWLGYIKTGIRVGEGRNLLLRTGGRNWSGMWRICPWWGRAWPQINPLVLKRKKM